MDIQVQISPKDSGDAWPEEEEGEMADAVSEFLDGITFNVKGRSVVFRVLVHR